MPYATEVMGVGSYVGEVEEGPDGQLYEWVEGVDGLGNPLGFWSALKRAAGGLIRTASRALPLAARFTRFTPWGAAASLVAPIARHAFARRRRPLHPYRRYPQYPQYQPAPTPMPPPPPMAMAPPSAMPMAPAAMPESAEAPQPTGTEGFGAIAEGPDGQLYEYVEGIGAFGERRPGRWRRKFRRLKRREGREDQEQEQAQKERFTERIQDLRERRRNIGESFPEQLAEGADGQLYEYVEGIGAFGERRPGRWQRKFRRLKRREGREDQEQEQAQKERFTERIQDLRERRRNIGESFPGQLAEGADGHLYEYVEGIGAMGESRPHWRPVRLCFPATIGPRRGRGRSYRRPTTASSSSSSSSAPSPYRRY
ncbi:hypothetical protein L0337_24990 [candidate division KSB1 bacterium]|nr:hypothetical protein [candidate division KSB1 bacterium]